MEYKVSAEMKWMFSANVMLFIVGIISQLDFAVMTSVIIFVILSVSIQILEAIYSARDVEKKQ